MAAVSELCDRLGVTTALDAAVGPIKQRDRGCSAGQLLTGIAAGQLAGEDFLAGLDRRDPGRGPHQALDALTAGIMRKRVNWVLDADIRDFSGSLDRGWPEKFPRHRIADGRVLRLIGKWLAAGVIEDGKWAETRTGSPQGASVSPLLASVYLHYVFDLRADWRRSRSAHGDVIIVRRADDFIVGFEHKDDAGQFLEELRGRFAKFGLELHPGKTRLIEFGRHAARNRAARGERRPETFGFPGFTHLCARSKNGRFRVRRITISKRVRARLAEVKTETRRRAHQPLPVQGRWLASVLRGHMAYYAVPGSAHAVRVFRDQVTRQWLKALRRRSQKGRALTWARMDRIQKRWLPPARTMHPFPEARFAAIHPRQEPSAVIPHAGICAGGRPQGRSLPRL